MSSQRSRFADVARKGREPQCVVRRRSIGRRLRERRGARSSGVCRQAFAAGRREQVEQDQHRRCFGGELADAAFRRVQPHLQRIEGECLADRDHELAVEDEAARLPSRATPPPSPGNSAPSGLPDLARSSTASPARKRETAEAVPFGLELPARARPADRRRAAPPSAAGPTAGETPMFEPRSRSSGRWRPARSATGPCS